MIITKCEIRFLNSWDHNMRQPRCDFVVHRADGTATRLHPSSKGPGEIVIGSLDDWLPHGHNLPRRSERDAACVAGNGIFRVLHQVDTISREVAGRFSQMNETVTEPKTIRLGLLQLIGCTTQQDMARPPASSYGATT